MVSGIGRILLDFASPQRRWRGAIFLGLWVLVWSALALAFEGCSPSAIERQAATAHTMARVANAALPVIVTEYERIGREVLERACCDRAEMRAALTRHQRTWEPVVLAWEGARLAHDAWRVEVDRCRETPTESCEPALEQLALRAGETLLGARCALRAVGREDLDPLPGPASCPEPAAAMDGGVQ